MAGRILKDDIETLRRQADAVAVVGDYTTLKRAGTRYKGLCPFHNEKTPSFTVAPDGNFFHCFGCDESGDLYDFLMRIEGLEFPEAVEALARRTGFTLRYEEMSTRDRQAVGQRSRLVQVTAAALEFFTRTLYADAGEVARAYLKERGFGREDAQRFDLGFAPNEWERLAQALTRQGFRAEDLIETGLVVRNERGGLRDRFRGRLIFPVHDPGGDVIGFGGRILPGLDYGDFDPPKYLNSPETPLYKKTRVLYGVPQARADIVRTQQVLICEGYTDVMALHQAGFGNAVATCGTAVGVEHLRMVSRYAQKVVFAFDGDEAGVKAAERAWEAARTLGGDGGGADLDLRVLVLEDGRDPADLVRDMGVEGMRDAVAGATPVVPFVLRRRLAGADLGSEAGRTAALHEAIEIVGREPDLDLRREWARTEVAAGIGVAYEFVVRSAKRLGVELDAHEGVAPMGQARQGRGGSVGGVASLDRARVRRERDVLRTALQVPQWLPDEWFELAEDDFTHPVARQVFAAVQTAGGAGVELAAVLDAAPDDSLRGKIREIALEDEVVPIDADVAAWRVRSLLADRLQAEERTLKQRLQTLHHTSDREELMAVLGELRELEARRRALTSVSED
ncbi:DNA primase [Egicoccus sp. AB-alg6-2]|uniref:DNA primase n=1 Tax=Egicoccus sp. AB-alg6-2 TaxID=3242692 RepID=UPI00359EA65E